MHAELIERFGLGHQEERCTSNVYLHKDVEGFVEYQTVHGSADDIAGRGLVNPTSTLRAAAQVFEAVRLEYLSSPASGGNDGISTAPGIVAAMEVALVTAARHGIATPDAGGSAKTVDVTEAVLAALGEASAQLQSV
jgi:isocitrate/isopropylmalate dehydrogenase